jgi:hypothetical protein
MRRDQLILSLALVACTGGGQTPEPEPQVRTTGTLCVEGASALADEPVTFNFAIRECLSSSCTENTFARCGVVRIEDRFVVTGEASWDDVTDQKLPNEGCTDDCLPLAASCQTPPLAAGAHAFEFTNLRFELRVPTVFPEPLCIESQD